MFSTETRLSAPPPSTRSRRYVDSERASFIRALLTEELGRAARLQIAFQPIVDIRTGQVVGAEALSRFRSEPYRTPDLWFADAHAMGLGVELELRAVEAALVAAKGQLDSGYIAVNVSPQALLSPVLAELLRTVSPDHVVLELTEHVRIDDYAPVQSAIAAFRARGFRLAIDDAGAGYSSFQHILRLRPDIIKLDRALTSGVNTNPVQHALASAMVTFASSLGAVICAEGIETLAEIVTLQRLGVRCGQGYFLGRPGPLPLPTPPAEIWFAAPTPSAAPAASPAVRSTSRLAALAATGLMDSEAEPAFDALTALASTLLRAPIALLSLVDERRQFFKSAYGISSLKETPLSHSFCAHAVTAKTPLLIEDASTHPLVSGNPAISEFGVSAYAGVPIFADNDEAIGAFCVVDSVPHAWSAADVAVLEALASMVSAHIQVRKRALGARRDAAIIDTLLEDSGASIMLYSVDGRMERVSAPMARFLGRSESELLASSPRLIHPDDRIASQMLREKLLGGERSRVTIEARFQRADGVWVPRSGTIRLLRDAAGAPEAFVVMLSPEPERDVDSFD